jgi:hypothetical protein
MIYLVGSRGDIGVIVRLKFDSSLKIICSEILDDKTKVLTSVSRLHGTDILMIGSDQYIFVI